MSDPIGELRISDILTFLAVKRLGSMSSASRELQVTSSQVSKAISRLEQALRVKLLVRSARGIELTAAALDVTVELESAVEALRVARQQRHRRPELTLAAPSYLLSALAPVLVATDADTRLRAIDMAPSAIRAWLNDGYFDLALSEHVERLSSSWSSTRVGTIKSGLFASPSLAAELGPGPHPPEKIATIPFVSPVHFSDGRFNPGNDDCPLPASARVVGHQTHTIGVAVELAARTRQLVFGPKLAARQLLRSGDLVEVKVEGWKVERALYVLCNIDRVRARTLENACAVVREALAELETVPG